MESRVWQRRQWDVSAALQPLQQAVVVLGGTSMWQVSAEASEAVIKLIKKTPKKVLKEQQSPAVLPRDALSTGNPFENEPNPQFHGFPGLMNPQTH